MPHKSCPVCGGKIGVRSKVCKFCKATIPRKDTGSLTPRSKGMDHERLRDYIVAEGFSECIWSLVPPEDIEDKHLGKLWRDARLKMRDVLDYLYPKDAAVCRDFD